MLVRAIQGVLNFISGAFDFIMFLLPLSPFAAFNEVAIENQFLRWLAWIVPIPAILGVLQAWASAIALFYIWKVALRWIRAIE